MLDRTPSTDSRARTRRREQQRVAQRRYREHVRMHVRIVPVAVSHRVLDYLIKISWLKENDADKRRRVGEAIARMLAEAAAAER